MVTRPPLPLVVAALVSVLGVIPARAAQVLVIARRRATAEGSSAVIAVARARVK